MERISQLKDRHWFVVILIVVALGIVALVLGCIGFSKTAAGNPGSGFAILYRSMQLFVLQSGDVPQVSPELEVARFLAPALTLSTFIVAFTILLFDNIQRFRLYYTIHDHVIVCGMGYLGPVLARYFKQRGYPVVVIEKDAKNRELEICREYGAIVLVGDATKTELLESAQIGKAHSILAVTGNDSFNTEIAIRSGELPRVPSASPLSCRVHIVDPQLCTLLKANEMSVAYTKSFRVEFFNIYQIAGHCMLKTYPPFPPDAGKPPHAHLLVCGIGRLGESLIAHSGKAWKERYGSAGEKLKITLFDIHADSRLASLKTKYPALTHYCDLDDANVDFQSSEFLRGDVLNATDIRDITGIYICLSDESLGLSVALALFQLLEDRHIPIVVRTTYEEGFAKLMGELNRTCHDFRNIHAFPLVSCTCCMDLLTGGTREIIARGIHEDYVHEQEKLGRTPETNRAMVPWRDLDPKWKESNRRQADSIASSVRQIGCIITHRLDWEEPFFEFRPDEVERLAEMEHTRWLQEKEENRQHDAAPRNPYMKPWSDLPEEMRDLTRSIVRAWPRILARVDLKILRITRRE